MSSTEIVKKKNTITEFFMKESRQKQLAMALPRVGITKERMIRLMFSAFNTVPRLLECKPQTLFNTMIQCASLGLEPNTALGHAYLIPFKNNRTNGTDVQLIIGYKGYLSLARRSGELSSISSHVVREGDEFEYQFGTEEHLKHIPDWSNIDKRPITFAYSVAKFKDGSTSFEIMSREEIELIRKRSKSPNNGPWITDYEMMCRKTVIRRHMHYLPLSIELSQAAQIDGQNESGIQDMSGILDIEATEINGNDQETSKPKKGSLEGIAEKEEKKEPPKESKSDNPSPREQLEIALGEFYGGDVDQIEKFLEEAIQKKIPHSLTEDDVLKAMAKLKEKQAQVA